MDFTPNYNPNKDYRETHEKYLENVGEPVDPSDEEVLTLWKKQYQNPPLRTINYIYDVRKEEIIRASGFKELGYPDNQRFKALELLSLIHENHFKMSAYQTLRLFEIFYENPEIIKRVKPTFTATRGLKDINGNYWFAHQASKPFQFDKDGKLVRYVTSYRIQGEYRGEALETDVYTDPKFPDEELMLKRLLKRIQKSMVNILELSIKQKTAIDLMLDEMSNQKICEELGVSQKTLDRYRGEITNKVREVFPNNRDNIKNYKDALKYLKKHNII